MDLTPLLADEERDRMRAFLQALDVHVPGEADHAERVAVYAVATGHEMGLSGNELSDLRRAATLHDVGKLSLDADLLTRLGDLTDEDFAELRRHAELSEELIGELDGADRLIPMIAAHHERFGGGGYPRGLVGTEIPLGARIIAVAEAWDVLTQEGGYRTMIGRPLATLILQEEAGKQFDPAVVTAFLRVEPLIQPLRLRLSPAP